MSRKKLNKRVFLFFFLFFFLLKKNNKCCKRKSNFEKVGLEQPLLTSCKPKGNSCYQVIDMSLQDF